MFTVYFRAFMNDQGRNFGLKSGGINSKENEAPLGPAGPEERRMGRNYPLLIQRWESVVSSPSGVWGGDPAENSLIVI